MIDERCRAHPIDHELLTCESETEILLGFRLESKSLLKPIQFFPNAKVELAKFEEERDRKHRYHHRSKDPDGLSKTRCARVVHSASHCQIPQVCHEDAIILAGPDDGAEPFFKFSQNRRVDDVPSKSSFLWNQV